MYNWSNVFQLYLLQNSCETAKFSLDNKTVSQVAGNIIDLKQQRRKKFPLLKIELALVTGGRFTQAGDNQVIL